MAELSPAARAVLDAAYALPLHNGQPSIAAALRVAALYCKRDRLLLHAIADELETEHD